MGPLTARTPLPAAPAQRVSSGMKRSLLVNQLAQVERHIREGERHIFRQREIVNELERHGHGNSQTAKMARDILDSFEMTQLAHLSDRAHLMQALREIT